MAATDRKTGAGSLLKDQSLSRIRFLNALLGSMPIVNPIVRTIQQSGIKRRVGEVLLCIPLLGCSAFLLNAFLGGDAVLGVVSRSSPARFRSSS